MVFVRARSAFCGVSVALALLLAPLGSNWSAWLTLAVLTCALELTTLALMVRVALAALARLPTLHTPVPLVYVPWLGVALTKVSPAGSRSLTDTFVAVLGPL